MSDSRYQYLRVNVIKAIIQNKQGKVLLFQEPETNEWMPGHLGLPGGKPLVKESLREGFERKMKEDLGQDIKIEGIFKIEELLIEGRTVLMFHVVGKVNQIKVSGESKAYRWVDTNDIKKMKVEEFTEYFNKKLLLNYLKGEKNLMNFGVIESQKYFELSNNVEYKKWFESGSKTNNNK